MINFGKIRVNKKGVALIATYMVIAVLLAFGGFVIEVSNSQNKAANTFKRQTQAINVAEAGLDRALVWMRDYLLTHGTYPPVNITRATSFTQAFPLAGSYVVDFPEFPALLPGIYRVRAIGTVGSVSQTVINYLQPDNFARYIWFTDTESYNGTNVWFWDQDHLNGPTYTSGHFNIKGNPVFGGEVLSVDDYIRYFNDNNNINLSSLSNSPHDIPVFQDTVELGVGSKISMPTQAVTLRLAAAQAGGLTLTGETTILLNSNGTMNVTNNNKSPKWNNKNMALPANGALFVVDKDRNNKGNLNISGTLNGRLTVGASGDINVTNNIVYADDPRQPSSTSTDTLGLISEGDVMISKDAPTNLEIDASIMALNTSFLLEEWWQNGAKGTLSVFGGIIQRERGPVGTFSGTTKVSGYSKNYNYDARLLVSPPPFVPTTGDYIRLTWEN